MKNTMKVTIGGKTTSVLGQPEIEAIKEILIFGVVSGREITSDNTVMTYGPKGPKLKKREGKFIHKKKAIWSNEDTEKLKEYAKDGMPMVKMAIMLDKKGYTVSNKLRSLHLLGVRKDAEKRKKMNKAVVEKKSEKVISTDLNNLRDDFRKNMENEGFNY